MKIDYQFVRRTAAGVETTLSLTAAAKDSSRTTGRVKVHTSWLKHMHVGSALMLTNDRDGETVRYTKVLKDKS